MRTIMTALTAFAGCTVTRWYLDRTSRRDEEFCQGRVRLRSLWNEGACFGAPVPKRLLNIASSAAMGALCGMLLARRKDSAAAGLLLGGGLSNLLERQLHGRVLDYVQFPKAPGILKRYVFNLADFAILTGGVLLAAGTEKDCSRKGHDLRCAPGRK